MRPSDLRRHAKQTEQITNGLIREYMRRAARGEFAEPDVGLDRLFAWRDRCRAFALSSGLKDRGHV